MRKYYTLAIIGGVIYGAMELACRGYTHWTMVILGGICFLAVGAINEVIPWGMPLILQMIIGGGIITALELAAGLIVNIGLGWGVWDYSNEWGNFLGQICPKYALIWVGISLIAILLDDWLRWELFGEEKPHYTIFGRIITWKEK